MHRARYFLEGEIAGDQVTVVAQRFYSGRFKRRLRISGRVEPRGLFQLFVGVTASGIDAVEFDREHGVGCRGVRRVEIQRAFELAERAVDP
ncbi:hypothetical protein D3C84_918530 [compost metagenome]